MAVRSVTPSLYVLPPWAGLGWHALLRTLAYPNAEKRDLRIDLLRGFCVFAMIVDHIGGSSWLYGLTGGNRWLVSAAEGFVFLSGLTMGMVYRDKVRTAGLAAAARSALRRAGTLYLLTVALSLIFTLLARTTDWALWTDRALADGQPLELLVAALTLHYTYHGADILALYTFLVVASPFVFFLLDRGYGAYVVAGSWLLWAGYQLVPGPLTIPWEIRNSWYFPLAAWQTLFVGGLVLGWYRKAISAAVKERLALLRNAPALLSVASPLMALGSVGWIDRGSLVTLGVDPMVGLFAKPNLGPGRIILFLAVFAAAYVALTLAWAPLSRLLGWLLLPLGQTTLYGYTMQLFLVVPLYNLLAVGSEAPEAAVANTLAQLGAVLAIWAMVKRKVLFGIVPR